MKMIIYIDLLLIINFIFDLLLLLTVNITLKRHTKVYRLLFSSGFGSLTLISLFIPLNAILMMFFKALLALIMLIIAFGYKNLKYTFYNLLYFYMCSVILGGFLYFLKIEFHLDNNLYYHGISISYIIILIIAPIILYAFIKSLKVFKEIKNYYYQVNIIFANNYSLKLTGFLDTGNKLIEPLTNKPIILINKKLIASKINIRSPMYVPVNTINSHSLLECIKPKQLFINNQKLDNYLIGLCDYSFKLNGIDCLLNYQILEDLC